jgi:hypothetical protein
MAFDQPGFAALEKPERLGPVAAPGNDEARGAVVLEAEKIAACARTADNFDREPVFPREERFVGSGGGNFLGAAARAGEGLLKKPEAELEHR